LGDGEQAHSGEKSSDEGTEDESTTSEAVSSSEPEDQEDGEEEMGVDAESEEGEDDVDEDDQTPVELRHLLKDPKALLHKASDVLRRKFGFFLFCNVNFIF
jgi:hypothetical protein